MGTLFGTLSADTRDQYWVPGVISLKLVAAAFNEPSKSCVLNSHTNETVFRSGLSGSIEAALR